jgi:hypothetical protein
MDAPDFPAGFSLSVIHKIVNNFVIVIFVAMYAAFALMLWEERAVMAKARVSALVLAISLACRWRRNRIRTS